MPVTAAWLGSAEALVNRYIDGSAQAGALARRLQGKTLQVNIEGVARIRAALVGGRLMLLTGEQGTAAGAAPADVAAAEAAAAEAAAAEASAADAMICGSPAALWRLFKGGLQGDASRPAAQIRGDAEVANQYRQLFLLARPDWEEELSRVIGDFPARRLSQFARGAIGYLRRARRTAGENIAEYLQEESQVLVNDTELQEFLRGVDRLRETADRIEARILRLERHAQGGA